MKKLIYLSFLTLLTFSSFAQELNFWDSWEAELGLFEQDGPDFDPETMKGGVQEVGGYFALTSRLITEERHQGSLSLRINTKGRKEIRLFAQPNLLFFFNCFDWFAEGPIKVSLPAGLGMLIGDNQTYVADYAFDAHLCVETKHGGVRVGSTLPIWGTYEYNDPSRFFLGFYFNISNTFKQ